jgi:hypothetical protein
VEAAWLSGEFSPGAYTEGRWVPPAELGAYPSSSPQRRLARILAGG